jgi:hypothetical protein
MHDSGDYNVAEIVARFSVSRLAVYRPWTARLSSPLPAGTPRVDLRKFRLSVVPGVR